MLALRLSDQSNGGVIKIEPSCQSCDKFSFLIKFSCKQPNIVNHAADDSTDQDSVRSSQNDLANYENKSAELPSIPEIDRIWRSYSELIAPKVLHVWASLAAALVSYNQLLKNRAPRGIRL